MDMLGLGAILQGFAEGGSAGINTYSTRLQQLKTLDFYKERHKDETDIANRKIDEAVKSRDIENAYRDKVWDFKMKEYQKAEDGLKFGNAYGDLTSGYGNFLNQNPDSKMTAREYFLAPEQRGAIDGIFNNIAGKQFPHLKDFRLTDHDNKFFKVTGVDKNGKRVNAWGNGLLDKEQALNELGRARIHYGYPDILAQFGVKRTSDGKLVDIKGGLLDKPTRESIAGLDQQVQDKHGETLSEIIEGPSPAERLGSQVKLFEEQQKPQQSDVEELTGLDKILQPKNVPVEVEQGSYPPQKKQYKSGEMPVSERHDPKKFQQTMNILHRYDMDRIGGDNKGAGVKARGELTGLGYSEGEVDSLINNHLRGKWDKEQRKIDASNRAIKEAYDTTKEAFTEHRRDLKQVFDSEGGGAAGAVAVQAKQTRKALNLAGKGAAIVGGGLWEGAKVYGRNFAPELAEKLDKKDKPESIDDVTANVQTTGAATTASGDSQYIPKTEAKVEQLLGSIRQRNSDFKERQAAILAGYAMMEHGPDVANSKTMSSAYATMLGLGDQVSAKEAMDFQKKMVDWEIAKQNLGDKEYKANEKLFDDKVFNPLVGQYAKTDKSGKNSDELTLSGVRNKEQARAFVDKVLAENTAELSKRFPNGVVEKEGKLAFDWRQMTDTQIRTLVDTFLRPNLEKHGSNRHWFKWQGQVDAHNDLNWSQLDKTVQSAQDQRTSGGNELIKSYERLTPAERNRWLKSEGLTEQQLYGQ